MKPEVEQAVEELRLCFGDAEILADGTADGGALVAIDPSTLSGIQPHTT